MPDLPDPTPSSVPSVPVTSHPRGNKEVEPTSAVADMSSVEMQEVGQEVEVAAEVAAWMEKKSERVDVPPDMQQLGVSGVGQAQPVIQTVGPKLPLTDEQIERGRSAKISSGLRWLAEWCVFQLQKLHIHLKKIQGAVVRERA